MAWAFEFRAGLGWAAIVTLLMVVAMWAEVQMRSVVPLVIPIVAYLAFFMWVERGVKK